MASCDLLSQSESVATPATGVCSPPRPGVAKVAGVAVATSRNSKVEGDYEAAVPLESAKPAGRHRTVAGVAGVAIATARNSKGEERAIDEPGHDSLFVSEHFATATPATPATPCFIESGAVTKTKDSKTGEWCCPQSLKPCCG